MSAVPVFAIAFGPPKPLHRQVVDNWRATSALRFVLLTDCYYAWRELVDLAGERITVVETSVLHIFTAGARLLGFPDAAALMARHGTRFFGGMNGWTVCGMRGLLADIYTTHVEGASLWGFIDYDVLLSPKLVAAQIAQNEDKDLLFAPSTGFLWEQFKLFSSRLRMPFHYLHLIKGEARPLEAALVYHLRGVGLKIDDLPQTALVAHWAHLDEDSRATSHHQDVTISPNWQLTNAKTGAPITIFIADSEVKYLLKAQQKYKWAPASEFTKLPRHMYD